MAKLLDPMLLIPMAFFEVDYYRRNMNSNAVILYGLLVSRINQDGYAVLSRSEAQKFLGISSAAVAHAFQMLSDVDLIVEENKGRGRSAKVYVYQPTSEPIRTS